jgi:ribosomal protein S18 acetylase RimI-like enzyme
MEVRAFAGKDAAEVTGLWNLCLGRDQLDIDSFFRRIIYDVNFDPSLFLLATEDRKIVGFIHGIKRKVHDEVLGLEPDKAWIMAMGVHPSYRNRGAGTVLLHTIENSLRERGAKRLDVGPYGSAYICPGIDKESYPEGVKFFDSRGYINSGESCSMSMNLWGFTIPPQYVEKKKTLEAQGFVFKPFSREDLPALSDFIREHFPSWLSLVRPSILEGRAEKTLIIALDKSGKVAGFVLRAMDGTEGRFGPFAIRPDLQGMGLGSVLFHEMMESMIRNRIYHTYFMWTSGRNLEIYGSWGMKIFRRYAMFYKVL